MNKYTITITDPENEQQLVSARFESELDALSIATAALAAIRHQSLITPRNPRSDKGTTRTQEAAK